MEYGSLIASLTSSDFKVMAEICYKMMHKFIIAHCSISQCYFIQRTLQSINLNSLHVVIEFYLVFAFA